MTHGLIGSGELHVAVLGKRDLLQRAAALANLEKLGNSRVPTVVFDDGHQPPGIAIRQRVQESGFQQSEDRRVAADPQREHQHDESRDAGVAAQQKHTVAEILERRCEPADHERVPHLLFRYRLIAHAAFGLLFRFRRIEPLFARLAQAHLAMKLEFLIEIAIQTPGPQHVHESPEESHQANLNTRVIASAARSHSASSSASPRIRLES